MAVCNCLIEATKGNQKRYYHATVEEDGFVYFNDKSFYRVETPQNLIQDLENDQTVTITAGIQYWYVVRDIWVYANRFDTLELSMPKEIDLQALQRASDTIMQCVNTVGRESIQTNGRAIYDLWNELWDLVTELRNQGINVSYPSSISVYYQWTDYPNVPVQ